MAMTSFLSYLNEVGDRPYPWKITIDTHDWLSAKFYPDAPEGEEPFHYQVDMIVTERETPPARRPGIPFNPIPPLPLEWEFGFGLVRPKNTKKSTVGARLHDTGYHYDTLVGDTKISLAVISTVSNIFQQFLRMKKPPRVIFSAKGDSRQRLYRRLMNRINTSIPGYSATEPTPGSYVVTRDR
jgi:hypothetical protein